MSVDRYIHIPEMESVAEKVPYITPDRIARKLSVEVMKRMPDEMIRKGIIPTQEVKGIIIDLQKDSSQSTAWDIVFDHTFPVKDRIFLLANKRAHPDMWMRDFVYTSEFTDSTELDNNILKTFEDRQKSNGQIPTAVGVWGSTPWHFADDESTLHYLISAANLVKKDGDKLTPLRRHKIKAAFSFVQKHVSDGMYVSPPGERRGWLDAFVYPKSDVVTQNQGFYAVSLLAAQGLGLPVEKGEVRTAIDLYKAMADFHGYLPLSARFNEAPDISTLCPEYFAMTRFGEQLLSDDVVRATLDATPKSNHGYKVLTTSPRGDYFDPNFFVTGYEKGNYQNGGAWPFWNNNALAVGELHGIVPPTAYRDSVMQQLDQTGWPEYIRTGGEFEQILTPERPRQVWNVGIPAQQRNLDRITA